MIVKEIIIINNKEYVHTYSNIGAQIERDGVLYSDAIDPIDSNREYVESDISSEEEISDEEFVNMIEEVL